MMLNENVRPSSLDGIKRLATQIKKQFRLPHSTALNIAARAASYSNYADAQRKLRHRSGVRSDGHQLFLTIYWHDSEKHSLGRETLEISLSKPLSDISSKGEMKLVRGLGRPRVAAEDHLVSDDVSDSQSGARELICKAVRGLRFMEATGLRPTNKRFPTEVGKLPGTDHPSVWRDPAHQQIILIDEPYGGDPDDPRRLAWAAEHNWHLRLSRWQGMYFPPHCNMFVATSAEAGYDFEALMLKIDSLAPPDRQEHWNGISAPTHDVFVSPAAMSPQARRRAKSQGTVMRHRTQATVPYQVMFGSRRRKPAGKLGIGSHRRAGELIKSILHSEVVGYAIKNRLNSLRCTLEDWLVWRSRGTNFPAPSSSMSTIMSPTRTVQSGRLRKASKAPSTFSVDLARY